MALYDIAGKAWGVPVHMILGGKRRTKVRVYSGGAVFDSPDDATRVALQVKAKGFGGVKGNPLETRRWPMDSAAVDHSVACVRAMREAVGEEFEIMLDCHGSPQPELGIEFARAVAPYRPLFLEEPVKTGSADALLEVSRKSPVPVAAGEKLFSLDQFLPLVQKRACAFLQPDISHCFGITHFMDIAAAARQQQMLMAPHMAGGPVFYAATLAAVAAIPNFLIQETNYWDLFDSVVEHDWRLTDGHLNISDAPGLGVTVKEQDLLKRFPYEPMAFRQYRHADGSWKGW
jgi:galactonate dehydratase